MKVTDLIDWERVIKMSNSIKLMGGNNKALEMACWMRNEIDTQLEEIEKKKIEEIKKKEINHFSTTRKIKEDGTIEEKELRITKFYIEKAKNGADVRTKKGFKVTIFDYNFKEKCTGRIFIAGKIEEELGDTLIFWDQKGEMADTKVRFFDLVILEEINYEYRWMVVSLVTGYTSQLFANKEEADHERIRRSKFRQDGNYQIVKLRVRV